MLYSTSLCKAITPTNKEEEQVRGVTRVKTAVPLVKLVVIKTTMRTTPSMTMKTPTMGIPFEVAVAWLD
jgi:hypothetical protein